MNSDVKPNSLLDASKVTVVVNTCDAYRDVWPLFFSALEEYWPDRSVDIVLNTETQSVGFEVSRLSVHNFQDKSGQDKWGKRLLETLNSIKTEYVVALYDDFILEALLDSGRLMSLVSMMDADRDIAVCYLTNMKLTTLPGADVCGQSLIEPTIPYRLNSAPALWRRKDLIRYTGAIDTPWAWEVYGSYRTYGDGKHFYCPTTVQDDVFHYNHAKGGAIYRGKWVAEVVEPKNLKYKLGMDLSIRGMSVEGAFEQRTLAWKLKFLWLGYRMVGFKSLDFFISSLSRKFK